MLIVILLLQYIWPCASINPAVA